MVINDLYQRYYLDGLDDQKRKELKEILPKVKQEELNSLEDHKKYLEILNVYRKSIYDLFELAGQNFQATLRSMLSVGEDGLYSNKLRFIYELIQNVDDCDYEKIDDCSLNIEFDWTGSKGKIVLTYNEKGFTPLNVFGITGIAEQIKNTAADKVEIGEKGIGFKSVFGIADRVLIESGLFSFSLTKEEFIVPIPEYKNFRGCTGTRLTLEMPSQEVKNIYEVLENQYRDTSALLNQNPILFLNKLTSLRFFANRNRTIKFYVQRKQGNQVNGILEESDVEISVEICKDGEIKSKRARCVRYTKDIIFGEKECKSRYGDKVSFKLRRHKLIAIFPIFDEKGGKDFEGRLYSFLPTQVCTRVPIVLHAPFKLDSSREFVDPQENNAWFKYTLLQLSEFLQIAYPLLAKIVKEDIVYYIPQILRNKGYQEKRKDSKGSIVFSNPFIAENGNQKNACLIDNDELQANIILKQKLFLTTGGSFECAKDIVSIMDDSRLEKYRRLLSLMNTKIFIAKEKVYMDGWFAIPTKKAFKNDLLDFAINNISYFEELLSLLEEEKYDYTEYFNQENLHLTLTKEHVNIILKNKHFRFVLVNVSRKYIEQLKLPPIHLNGFNQLDNDIKKAILDALSDVELNEHFTSYKNKISLEKHLYALEGCSDNEFLILHDGIALAEHSPYGAFAEFCQPYDKHKTFSATLQIRQASDKLNDVSEDISNADYLKLLREVRQSLITAYGKPTYQEYINIINKAGSNSYRFINELLQNADDCQYETNITPTFQLKTSSDGITVTYNEKGFTKQNVRAITAIGESTKKKLLNNQHNIGEKGIGFKSVFGVAESVEIHSNGFDFKLTEEKPTVPEKCKELKDYSGTLMKFIMKQEVSKSFDPKNLLSLCLCLRNLKVLDFDEHHIEIKDMDEYRYIKIDENSYKFKRFVYEFEVTDEKAITERSDGKRIISKDQSIVIYSFDSKYDIKPKLYVGLPTETIVNIPLIIDAPFDLTTSREHIVDCAWNNYVRKELYTALIEFIKKERYNLGIDVLKYVKLDDPRVKESTKLKLFTDEYLNNSSTYLNEIRNIDIIPIIGKNVLLPLAAKNIAIAPPFIIESQDETEITNGYTYNIVDFKGKERYIELLRYFGCERMSFDCNADYINNHIRSFLSSKELRNNLYEYLIQSFQESQYNWKIETKIKALPILPVRTSNGIEYRAYCENMYLHASTNSTDRIIVVDNEIIGSNTLSGLRMNIPNLTHEVYEAQYQKDIKNIISSNLPLPDIAKKLLEEYQNNYEMFSKCEYILKGLLDNIPLLMEDGRYKVGNKFVDSENNVFYGSLLKRYVVQDTYVKLAKFIGCEDLKCIYSNDFDDTLGPLRDDDIDDLQICELNNQDEIFRSLIKNGYISSQQVVNLGLECYTLGLQEEKIEDEEFPGETIPDKNRVHHNIAELCKTPNRYVEKQYTKHEPQRPFDKEQYTKIKYGSLKNRGRYFCQMCNNTFPERYIERNNLQKDPKFAWKQTYLSLCLQCSKDFILYRNNDFVWERFQKELKNKDIDSETVTVRLDDNQGITFTAAHLAEVQEILKQEKDIKE